MAAFDWRSVFDLQVSNPQDRAAISHALDRIAATPAGKKEILAAFDNCYADAEQDLKILHGLAVEKRNNPDNPETAEKLKMFKYMNDQISESSRPFMPAMGAERGKWMGLVLDGRENELPKLNRDTYRIPIVPAALMLADQVDGKLLASPEATQTQYMGKDGKYHDSTMERVLTHEIGHLVQKVRVKFAYVASQFLNASRECVKGQDEALSIHKTPQGIKGIELTALDSMTAEQKDSLLALHDKIAACVDAMFGPDFSGSKGKGLAKIEEDAVNTYENPVMKQVDPASPPQGDYYKTRPKPRSR